MTIGSLFSGVGGLEMGLEMCGLGPVLWQCDSDPHARAVLEAHWPGVRRYEDVRAIDAAARPVDLICGGFPCQPHSQAGKKKGTADVRWLWPEFARILAALRPRAVFVENVPGLRTSGLRDVLVDLAALGFDAEWGLFSAAQAGAPHRRLRLFLVAYAHGSALRVAEQRMPAGWQGRVRDEGEAPAVDDGAHLAHAVGAGPRGSEGPGPAALGRRQLARAGGAGDLADADGGGCALGGESQPGGQQGEAGGVADRRGGPPPGHRFPPGPDGIAEWDGAQPSVRRGADGTAGRTHRLRLLGNACVPAQAALAWRTLSARCAA